MIAKKIWIVNIFCACVACTDPSQKEADTNVDRDADERDVVQDQDTDNLQDAVEFQDFDVYDISDTTIHDVVDTPDDFQELEDVQDEEEARDAIEPTWDIDEEIRNSTGYQECLAQYNDVVQQALQDLPDLPEPEPDDTLDTFTQLSLGQNHGCALHTDGSLYCWGDNRYRQSEPPTEGRFVQVVSRYNTSCALEDTGRAVCWGENANDEIPGLYRQIAVGCGIRTEGSAYCWDFSHNTGDTIEGDFVYINISFDLCLINTQRQALCISPIGVPDTEIPDLDFISVQSNYYTHCGETLDRRVVCWNSEIPLIRNENRRIHLYQFKESEDYVAVYQDNTWEWGREYSGYSLDSYDQLDRTQFIDIDTNETQHCAINGQGLLQCWTKRGYKKQNLLYDRFLDYDFGCSVMRDHTLYCEEGNGDHFSNNTNILFDSIDTRGLNMAVSTDQDIYYFQNTFEGEENEYDLYYFQGPFENIVNFGNYFCATNENNIFNCYCRNSINNNVCEDFFEERVLFFNENFHQIKQNYYEWNKNCGINNNGNIACWQDADPNTIQITSQNKFIDFDFFDNNYCGITCEGNLKCFGEYEPYHREDNGIFKKIIGSYSAVCGITINDKIKCFGPFVGSRVPDGSFEKIVEKYDTACAQRESGSVVCWGYQRGGE